MSHVFESECNLRFSSVLAFYRYPFRSNKFHC
jgi:hypothetical protein